MRELITTLPFKLSPAAAQLRDDLEVAEAKLDERMQATAATRAQLADDILAGSGPQAIETASKLKYADIEALQGKIGLRKRLRDEFLPMATAEYRERIEEAIAAVEHVRELVRLSLYQLGFPEPVAGLPNPIGPMVQQHPDVRHLENERRELVDAKWPHGWNNVDVVGGIDTDIAALEKQLQQIVKSLLG